MRGAAILASALALSPAAGHADGAFPDAMQLLLPADRPSEIGLGTNFGVLLSRDGAASWRWVCEESLAPFPTLFQIGPPPDDTLFTVTPIGLLVSFDRGCHFDLAQGSVAGRSMIDAFPDPTDPKRVMAIAVPRSDGGLARMDLFESKDGGRTFGPSLYTAPAGSILTGVEIARSAPSTVYLTQLAQDAAPMRPSVLRSSDGGASFLAFDAGPSVGDASLRIAAVDPIDPQRVYFTVAALTSESLAISDDGGATLRIVVTHPIRLSAFLRRANGTLLLAARDGALFKSTDGGKTFSMGKGPRLRALGERDGVLYGAADNFADNFAVGTSPDDGTTWQPLFHFDEICSPLDCPHVEEVCAPYWPGLVSILGITPAPACFPDGGVEKPDMAGGGKTPCRGCCCEVGGRGTGQGVPWVILGFVIALLVFRSRRRT